MNAEASTFDELILQVEQKTAEGNLFYLRRLADKEYPGVPDDQRDRLLLAVAKGLYALDEPHHGRRTIDQRLGATAGRIRQRAARLALLDPLDMAEQRVMTELAHVQAGEMLDHPVAARASRRLKELRGLSLDHPKSEFAATFRPDAIDMAAEPDELFELALDGPQTLAAPMSFGGPIHAITEFCERPINRKPALLQRWTGVTLNANQGALSITRSGRLLPDTFNYAAAFSLWMADNQNARAQAWPRPVVVALDAHAERNYCHWGMDALFRVISLVEHYELDPTRVDVVVPHRAGFVVESLGLLGFPPERIIVADDIPAVTPPAVYLSSSSFLIDHPAHFGSTTALQAVRERFGVGAEEVGCGEPLYVSRRDATIRRFNNEDEVTALVERHGYQPYCPGEASFSEQLATFAACPALVGPHGAGLTNLIFAPRSASVVEIFPPRHATAAYFLTATALGQQYVSVATGAEAAERPLQFASAAFGKEDHDARLDLLETALGAVA